MFDIKNVILIEIVILIMVSSFTIVFISKKNHAAKKYLQAFNLSYSDYNDVRKALEIAREYFNPKSSEYKAIDKAIRYLYSSCLMDYETAFMIIEKTFTTKEVEEIHQEVIVKEKNKMLYLLEKGE